MDTVKFFHPRKPQMIAHRGVSGLETENTCAAFVAAGNRSYFGVETDVHASADGVYILSHDDNVRRVSGEELRIPDTDAATLRALTLYDKASGQKDRGDLRLPLLEEYVRICRWYEKTCVLEVKETLRPRQMAGIVESIRALGWLEHTIFISFAHENLVELRRLLPAARLQFLTGDAPDEALLARLLPWRLDLDIYYKSLTQQGLALMHQNGVQVNCWTVDEAPAAAQLADWGVDYITSNILE